MGTKGRERHLGGTVGQLDVKACRCHDLLTFMEDPLIEALVTGRRRVNTLKHDAWRLGSMVCLRPRGMTFLQLLRQFSQPIAISLPQNNKSTILLLPWTNNCLNGFGSGEKHRQEADHRNRYRPTLAP